MGSLLKNQILKHLSKFTKNLSPDRINLSAIKGEGELSNLELDEEVLTDLLELPTWLKITRASCNRVAIKIQWTKLKSQPICLYLDEVVVEMETCETPRPPSSSSSRSPLSPGGKYGFIDKVMDGIFVHVNSVIVKMMSRTFSASLQLSRVKVHSTTPTWGATNDLRTTRIRDTSRGEILVFKEIEWQTTRIEAAADESLSQESLTPLRLIANQAKIRVVLKKKLSDCSIMASRVILLLDDLLWVLTVTQLKAAILYANSLKEVIERSAQQSKRLAAEKLKRQGIMGGGGAAHAQAQRPQESSSMSAAARLFTRFDVTTTSYHLVTSRFDLHLCDDTSAATDCNRHWDISNGSMQITFFRLSFDFYPFHLAGGERNGWFRYTDNIGTRNPWVQKLFAAFREDAVKIRKICGSPNPSPSVSTTKLSSVGTGSGSNNPSPLHSPSHSAAASPSRSPSQNPSQQRQKSARLLESCCVIKVEDLTIYMVSTPSVLRKGSAHQKLLVSDKKQLHLPADMSVVHMEYTEYFFPDGMNYPVLHPNLYIMVNPVKVTVDFLTLLWSQYFLFTLAQSVELDIGDQGPMEHVDIKLEALMPRVVVPSEVKVEGQPDRPDALQLQISKLTASNCRMDDNLTRNDLRRCLDAYYASHLFHTAKFPNDSLPFRLSPWQLENHASGKDNPFLDKSVKGLLEGDPHHLQCQDAGGPHVLSTHSLKMDATCDVWGLHLEQVWVEFLGVQNARNRPVPCVEAFPLTLWLGTTQNTVRSSTEARHSVQSSTTLQSEVQQGSLCDSPLPQRRHSSQHEGSLEDSRPAHLPLAETRSGRSFDDCLSLQSEELNLQQTSDETAFVLSHFGAKMRVQVNHHQYLFLLRLSESFTTFQEELAADLALWGSTKSRVVHFPVSFSQAELAIVCPYQMDQRTFSDDFSPSMVNFPDVFGVAGSVVSGGNSAAGGLDTVLPEPAEGVLTNQAYQLDRDEPVDNNNIIPILNRDNDPSPTPLSRETNPTITHTSFHDDLPSSDLNNSTAALDQLPPLSFMSDPKSQMSMSAGTDSGISLDRKSSLKTSGKSKGAEMKKAFSSAFSNFTDKLKNTFDDNGSEDIDSLSVKTDTSDDDDDFEQLSLDDTEEVPAFIHEGRSDAGSNPDTYSDMDTSSIYADSSTTKGREMVSLILVKLDRVEGLLQVCDACTVLAAQVAHVQLHQPGNVGYDDFYGKFASAKGFIQEDSEKEADLPAKFPLMFKFHQPASPPGCEAAADPGAMTVRVEDYSLKFKMSGTGSLSEFVEDESKARVVPMSVTVRNFLLVLDEDRAACSTTSQGGTPINCHIDYLYITRGKDGIIYLTSADGSARSDVASPCADDTDTVEARGPQTPSSASSLTLLTQTQTENVQLRRQCEELHRANKLYEEQLVLLRDKMRDYELQLISLQQQAQHSNKARPQSPRSKNHGLSSSPARGSVSEGSGAAALGTEIQAENAKLQQRIVHLEDNLLTATKEKESLVSTLQFLQEELLKSERRARSNTATH